MAQLPPRSWVSLWDRWARTPVRRSCRIWSMRWMLMVSTKTHLHARTYTHDDVKAGKRFPHHWLFVMFHLLLAVPRNKLWRCQGFRTLGRPCDTYTADTLYNTIIFFSPTYKRWPTCMDCSLWFRSLGCWFGNTRRCRLTSKGNPCRISTIRFPISVKPHLLYWSQSCSCLTALLYVTSRYIIGHDGRRVHWIVRGFGLNCTRGLHIRFLSNSHYKWLSKIQRLLSYCLKCLIVQSDNHKIWIKQLLIP